MFQRVHVYISFPCGHCQGVGMRKKGCSNIPTHTSTKCSKTAQKQWTAFSGSSPSPQLWESLTLGSSNVATFFERNHCQCRTKNSFPWTSEEPLGQLLLLPFLSSETPRGGERAGQRLGGQRQERERGLGAGGGGGTLPAFIQHSVGKKHFSVSSWNAVWHLPPILSFCSHINLGELFILSDLSSRPLQNGSCYEDVRSPGKYRASQAQRRTLPRDSFSSSFSFS